MLVANVDNHHNCDGPRSLVRLMYCLYASEDRGSYSGHYLFFMRNYIAFFPMSTVTKKSISIFLKETTRVLEWFLQHSLYTIFLVGSTYVVGYMHSSSIRRSLTGIPRLRGVLFPLILCAMMEEKASK